MVDRKEHESDGNWPEAASKLCLSGPETQFPDFAVAEADGHEMPDVELDALCESIFKNLASFGRHNGAGSASGKARLGGVFVDLGLAESKSGSS